MPTLFDLLGLSVPAEIYGTSLLPLIRENATLFRAEHFTETTPAGWQALADDDLVIYDVRTQRWKLILRTDARRSSSRYELFDLTSDPSEMRNLYDSELDLSGELKEMLDDYLDGH